MSAIDRLKELLAAATGSRASSIPHEKAERELKRHAQAIAEELVASQEALGGIITGLEADDHYCCHHARLGRDDHTEDCYVGAARAALRLDSLAKAMESR